MRVLKRFLKILGRPQIQVTERKAKLAAAKAIKQLFINKKARHGAALVVGEKIIYI